MNGIKLYRPHDILKINVEQSAFSPCLPEWAMKSLQEVPFVVVRRGKSKAEDHVAVGIRGKTKAQRFACEIRQENILQRYTPYEILANFMDGRIENNDWKGKLSLLGKILRVRKGPMERVCRIGIGGSVGFELVSGQKVTSEESDVDIILVLRGDFNGKLDRDVCLQLCKMFDRMPVTIDSVLETKEGWVSLREYATSSGRILVKTAEGCELLEELTELQDIGTEDEPI